MTCVVAGVPGAMRGPLGLKLVNSLQLATLAPSALVIVTLPTEAPPSAWFPEGGIPS